MHRRGSARRKCITLRKVGRTAEHSINWNEEREAYEAITANVDYLEPEPDYEPAAIV